MSNRARHLTLIVLILLAGCASTGSTPEVSAPFTEAVALVAAAVPEVEIGEPTHVLVPKVVCLKAFYSNPARTAEECKAVMLRVPINLPLFVDGFESGDLGEWN